MELWAFSSQFAVGIVGYAGTTIIHAYFIAITFAGSLERYLNSFLGTRQMLMHRKPWVIPILFQRCGSAGYSFTTSAVSVVAAVKRLHVLHYSVVYILWSFVIIELIPDFFFESLFWGH